MERIFWFVLVAWTTMECLSGWGAYYQCLMLAREYNVSPDKDISRKCLLHWSLALAAYVLLIVNICIVFGVSWLVLLSMIAAAGCAYAAILALDKKHKCMAVLASMAAIAWAVLSFWL